jgi:hypothetical protein
MGWSYDSIERDWLAGSRIAVAPQEVVSAFDLAERVLGRTWIEAARMAPGGPVSGAAPTLHVIAMGRQLAALEGVAGTEPLITGLRRGDESAAAELAAISLFRSQEPFAVELYPPVTVEGRPRQPDFRLRLPPAPWTYVEVTRPGQSQASKGVRAVLERLAGVLRETTGRFTLEVFLRREPSPGELDALVTRMRRLCAQDGVRRDELGDLGDLGVLLLNTMEPGLIEIQDHPGEEQRPRLSMGRVAVEDGRPARHIVVRLPFTDQRARAILSEEARQLPRDAPGLVMVQTSNAPGAMRAWEPLLRSQMQPAVHTRVSAVCLFASSFLPTPSGEAWVPLTKLIENPHRRFPLPPPIGDTLSGANATYEHLTAGTNRAAD